MMKVNLMIILGIILIVFISGCDDKTNPYLPTDCKDSDGGINYLTKGSIILGDKNYTDTCRNEKRLRNEYYCSDNEVESKTGIYCEFGCEDGACRKEPLISADDANEINAIENVTQVNITIADETAQTNITGTTCTDSDSSPITGFSEFGGADNTIRGTTVRGNVEKKDSCIIIGAASNLTNDTSDKEIKDCSTELDEGETCALKEYYCTKTGDIDYRIIKRFCKDAAIAPTPECISSNAVKDIFIQSQIVAFPFDKKKTYKDECVNDTLKQWYCDSTTTVGYKIKNCTNGCDNGACINTTCTNECDSAGISRCTDSYMSICGNFDKDKCLEWSSPGLCQYGCGENNVCKEGAGQNISEPSDTQAAIIVNQTPTPCEGGLVYCVDLSHAYTEDEYCNKVNYTICEKGCGLSADSTDRYTCYN